jgi:DNA-binding transcriptional LysR family regulator
MASSNTRSRTKSSSRCVLVALRRDGTFLDLATLTGVPLVLTPPGTSMRNLVDLALRDLGIAPLIAVETEQRDALVPLVLAGAGTAFVPSAIAEVASTQGAVVRRTNPAMRRKVVLVHRSGILSPAGARVPRTRAGVVVARLRPACARRGSL